MSQENKDVEIAALLISGLATAGKLIIDGIAAAGARGEALYELAVKNVADMTHRLEERDPARFKTLFDDARAKLRAKFHVEAEAPRNDEPTKPGG